MIEVWGTDGEVSNTVYLEGTLGFRYDSESQMMVGLPGTDVSFPACHGAKNIDNTTFNGIIFF